MERPHKPQNPTSIAGSAEGDCLQARTLPRTDCTGPLLQTAFTGIIVTGLTLVAIVVGALMFAFGEGGAKCRMAGIIFGVGIAICAMNFMSLLFQGLSVSLRIQKRRNLNRCREQTGSASSPQAALAVSIIAAGAFGSRRIG